MRYYISQAPANPLARIFAAIIAAASLVAAFFFGLVILAVIAGAIALFSLVFWLRMMWLGWKSPPPPMQQQGQAQAQSPAGTGQQDYIEAEYTVISERRD